MALLDDLRNNKGTQSSELGKTLAIKVMDGDKKLLKQLIEYTTYERTNKKEKNVRSTAAKAIECIAFEKPKMIAPYLEMMLQALEVDEPQTRWMIIRIMGLCAKENLAISKQAIPYAKKYIREKVEGQLCLVSSADLYLGDYGAISKENTKEVFSILLESTENIIENEHDWIIESFLKIIGHLSKKEKEKVTEFANGYKDYPRKKTQERVKRLLKECE